MNTIQSAWDYFKESVLPNDMESTEIEQYKATFYAGGAALNVLFKKIADMDCSPDAKRLAALSIIEEIDDFFKEKNALLDQQAKGGGNG